ncbi:MAG: HD-GYP domain-containing protein [Actinobacteria bacterium]|nr:HD-GYP domain-containing protein [Actinomycetota bacterium]
MDEHASSINWQGWKAEAQRTFIWVGRLAAAAWVLGAVLSTAYILSTESASTQSWVLLLLCLVGCVASLTVPWQRADRWWVLPMILYATLVISAATVVLDKPGISAFHLFPLLFLAFFYWGRWNVIIPGYALWCALFVGAEVLRDGPVSADQMIVAMPTFIATSAMVGVLAHRVRGVSSTERKRFKATVEALCAALSARDGYTGEHSAETLELVNAVTGQLALAREAVETIADVALLHDIGKIGIPNEILHSPGKLDESQWEIMKQHPVIGERIVSRIPGLEEVARAIRHEHERWDGKGYPDGLKGSEIPLASRIVLVCDAYHAMTSDRPYRTAMPEEDARAELVRHAGTQFDPVIVGALLSSFDGRGGMGIGGGELSPERVLSNAFGRSAREALQSA